MTRLLQRIRRWHPSQLLVLWVAAVVALTLLWQGRQRAMDIHSIAAAEYRARIAEAAQRYARGEKEEWPAGPGATVDVDSLRVATARKVMDQVARRQTMTEIGLAFVAAVTFAVTWIWFGGRTPGGNAGPTHRRDEDATDGWTRSAQ
jgi:hypothetical protein